MKNVYMYFGVVAILLGMLLSLIGVKVMTTSPLFQAGAFDFATGEVISTNSGDKQETTYQFQAKDGSTYTGVIALNTDLSYVGEIVTVRYVINNPQINEVNIVAYLGTGSTLFYIIGAILLVVGACEIVTVKALEKKLFDKEAKQ